MANFSTFTDAATNRRYDNEQEGFAKAINVQPGELLICGSAYNSFGLSMADFRGPSTPAEGLLPGFAPGWTPAYKDRHAIEWETTPTEAPGNRVFTWVGGSQVRPVRPAFPYATARLCVDGVERLRFQIGWPQLFTVSVDGFNLDFEPRRFTTLTELAHRAWEPHGISGFYRLEVPAKYLTAGKPICVRVEIDPPPAGTESTYFVAPRSDALRLNLAIVRDELAQLQADMVSLKRATEQLWAQQYPDLFPARVKGERVIALQSETLHYHPSTITVLRSGDAVITAREATDHLAPDGRMIFVRSSDGGRTWGPRQIMYQLTPVSDHRNAPIFELPNGDWLTTDYRAAGIYTADRVFSTGTPTGASLWGARSTDQGKTWQFCDQPMATPGKHPFLEVERHMIQLPAGRLLVAGAYMPWKADGKTPEWDYVGMSVFASDDSGRTWQWLSNVPEHEHVIGEPTLLRTRTGRIIMLARSELKTGIDYTCRGPMFQCHSDDDGRTWIRPEPTALSSMSAPGHLLQLKDGRILVSHAARAYPGSIFVTLSNDDGRTWDTAHTRVITNDLINYDSTYPTSGQLPDGTILTTWYGNLFGKFFLAVLRYRPEDL